MSRLGASGELLSDHNFYLKAKGVKYAHVQRAAVEGHVPSMADGNSIFC